MTEVEINDYMRELRARLEKGSAEYHDRSIHLPSRQTVREICQELVDVSGWAAILWNRLRRIERALPPEA